MSRTKRILNTVGSWGFGLCMVALFIWFVTVVYDMPEHSTQTWQEPHDSVVFKNGAHNDSIGRMRGVYLVVDGVDDINVFWGEDGDIHITKRKEK